MNHSMAIGTKQRKVVQRSTTTARSEFREWNQVVTFNEAGAPFTVRVLKIKAAGFAGECFGGLDLPPSQAGVSFSPLVHGGDDAALYWRLFFELQLADLTSLLNVLENRNGIYLELLALVRVGKPNLSIKHACVCKP